MNSWILSLLIIVAVNGLATPFLQSSPLPSTNNKVDLRNTDTYTSTGAPPQGVKCKDDLCSNIIKDTATNYCSVSDADNWVDKYRPRKNRAMPGLMRGLAGTFISNPVTQILSEDRIEDINWIDVIISAFAKNVFPILLASLAIGWTVISLLKCCGMCCSGCRKCYGFFLCGRCCVDRIRLPINDLDRRHVKTYKVCSVISLVIATVFTLLGFIYTTILGVDIQGVYCVPYSNVYTALVGEESSQYNWQGFDSLSSSLDNASDYYMVFETTKENDNSGGDFATSLRAEADNLVDEVIKLNLKEKTDEIVDTAAASLISLEAFKHNEATPLYHKCLLCDLLAADPNSENAKAEGSTVGEELKNAVEEINNTISEARDLVYKETGKESNFADVSNEIINIKAKWEEDDSFEELTNEIVKLSDNIIYSQAIIGHAPWILSLIVLILATGAIIYGTVITVRLWKNFNRETEPEVRKMRNHFGCLWIWYASLGIFLLMCGVVFFPLTQMMSSGCNVIQRDIIESANFSKYPLLKGLDIDDVDLEVCLTGDGALGDAVPDLKKVLADLNDSTETVKKDLSENFNMVREDLKDIQADVEQLSVAKKPIFIIDVKKVITETLEQTLVAFDEALLGSVNEIDIEVDSLPKDARDILKGAFEELKERTDDGEWKTIYSLNNLVTRINTLIPPGCNLVPITKESEITVSPEESDIKELYDCIIKEANEDLAKKVYYSIYWWVQRLRLIEETGVFTKKKEGDGSTPIEDIEEISYAEFNRIVESAATDIQSAIGINDEDGELKSQLDTSEISIHNAVDVGAEWITSGFLDKYSCKVALEIFEDITGVMCYNLGGDVIVLMTSLLIISVCFFALYILSWRQWHYWRDRCPKKPKKEKPDDFFKVKEDTPKKPEIETTPIQEMPDQDLLQELFPQDKYYVPQAKYSRSKYAQLLSKASSLLKK